MAASIASVSLSDSAMNSSTLILAITSSGRPIPHMRDTRSRRSFVHDRPSMSRFTQAAVRSMGTKGWSA